MELSSDDSGSVVWRCQPMSLLKAASRKEDRLVIGHEGLSPEGTEGPLCKLDPLGGDVCYFPGAQVKDVKIMKINSSQPWCSAQITIHY